MRKAFLVALHEYKRHVFNRRFLLALMSVPLAILLIVGLVVFIISTENKTTAVGYIDHSGLLADPLPAPPVDSPDKPIQIVAFTDQESADAALASNSIQAIITIPEDYRTSGTLEVVHIQPVSSNALYQFYDFLGINLMSGFAPSISERVLSGSEIIIRTLDGKREISSESGFLGVIIPLVSAFGFIFAIFTTGGYLVSAVVEEKENRTMEVVLTSVSPNQFMSGKILADISIGLTQILVWLIFIIIGLKVASNSVPILRDIRIDPQVFVLCLVILLPTFVMVSAFMALVGSTVAEAREGQQLAGLLAIPIWIPYMLISLILENPNSSLSVVFSLVPMTSSMTMLIRQGATIIPTWQIALSSLILVVCAAGAIWLAGRAFHLGMLRYGKRISLREILGHHKEVTP
jgi:ABC-2 type transport system permease protein